MPDASRTEPEHITQAVVTSFDAAPDRRARELFQALARHLHAFAEEVTLTEPEVMAAVRALTRSGQISDDRRQEFVLWADVLGLSMLVDALANPLPDGVTESTVLGPFYVPGSPEREFGSSIVTDGAAGQPALIHGRITDPDGAPVSAAEIDVWQNGEDRLYAVQRPDGPEDHLRGRFKTRPDGSYAFVGVRPVPYTIPDDGPVGEMLSLTRRHPWRPAHIHMIVRAAGYRTLTTHIFDADSDYLDSDAVFAVKPSLVRRFEERAADDPARPPGVSGKWFSARNDIVLAREKA